MSQLAFPGRRTECSVLTCAWKAPRVLTGCLATTAPAFACSGDSARLQRWRGGNNKLRFIQSKLLRGDVQFMGMSHVKSPKKVIDLKKCTTMTRENVRVKWNLCARWRLCCSNSSLVFSGTVTIEKLWEVLKPSISYLSPAELEKVAAALKLAFEAHNGQKRRSGEPFIIHPVEVARIIGNLELDCESIIAGLLHDTVEDSNLVTFERIEKEFGAVVRRIVEGETKVSKLGKLQCHKLHNSAQDARANDLRQMFLAMTEEVRIIIVKLADRLHNMRTLSYMPQHKQCSIASETLEIFAPLAKLLGMYQIKSELETLSLMYTKPYEFAELKRRVRQLFQEQERELMEAKKLLVNKMDEDPLLHFVGMDIRVISVCKEIYSVYKMTSDTKCSINEINDIAQLRIILKQKPCLGASPPCSLRQICYHILGLVHGMWTPIPRAMKDYIATPKPNGYQSLHTKVIPFLCESTFRVEVQIRTEEMDKIAQRGIAVYYNGKEITSLNKTDIARKVSWLNAIREWQDEFVGNMTSREFVDTVTLDLLGGCVFVFTPKGEIKNLPKGATVVDYAYQIHTEIGNKMVAAKVNGNVVSPMHKLANAEVVEIIVYDGLPSKESYRQRQKWLQHVKTRSARHKISKFLKEHAATFADKTCKEFVNNMEVVSLLDSLKDPMLDRIGFHLSTLPNYPPSGTYDLLTERRNFLSGAESSKLREEFDNLQLVQNKSLSFRNQGQNHNDTVPEIKMALDGESKIVNKNGRASAQLFLTTNGVAMSRTHMLESHGVENISSHERSSTPWICVTCIDREDILSEISSLFALAGIQIYGLAVKRHTTTSSILFRIEGGMHNMVNACSQLNAVQGIITWSIGCRWHSYPHPIDEIFEC
eukprot:TRINITY_DN21182_c0_g1_i1.p1 TRINITY_DN21182_c0_g1~~TRINITY_DN21182_c0_g1_i1.p1  ORF type:complete len:876 (-),score=133.89 TRINITY_DN21182_c0_g1_i1:439-3066(-)